MDAGVAALLGAAVAGTVALLSQFVGGWISARNSRRERLSNRLTEFLSSTYACVLAIGQVARADGTLKDELERDLVWPYIDRTNQALSEIEIHDKEELVTAAVQLDRGVAKLMQLARASQFDRADWRAHREAAIDPPLREMKAVARRQVHPHRSLHQSLRIRRR